MNAPVIVVESEAKAATLRDLFPEWKVVSLPGMMAKAVWLVPKDKLKRARPRFGFQPLPEARPLWDQLISVSEQQLYLAADDHQQGEYWAWLLSGCLTSLCPGRSTPGRLRLPGLGREELRRSLLLADMVRDELATAHHLRSQLNGLLVKHLERLLGTRCGPENLPLDHATLTILALLADREAAAAGRPAGARWQIRVSVAASPGQTLAARLRFAHGITDDGYFRDAEQARAAMSLFRETSPVITEIKRGCTFLEPPLPFRLPDLLQEAFLLHRLTPHQSWQALSDLFAGIGLAGTRTGLITPPLALVGVPLASVAEQLGKYLEDRGQAIRATEMEKGSLLPLQPEIGAEDLPAEMAAEVRLVYGLVRARALASLMPEAELESTEIIIKADGCYFAAGACTATKSGYLAEYQGPQGQALLAPSVAAALREGQPLELLQIIPEQVSVRPPEHYGLADLFADLGDYGMEADVSAILRLNQMLAAGYIDLLPGGALRSGPNGVKVQAVLQRALPTLGGLQLSAFLEQLLQEMVTGRKPIDFALRQFEQNLIMQGNVVAKPPRMAPMGRRAGPARGLIKAAAREEVGRAGAAGLPAGSGSGGSPAAAAGEAESPVLPSDREGRAGAEAPETAAAAATGAAAAAGSAQEAEPAMEAPPGKAEEDRPCPACGRALLVREDRFGDYLSCAGFPSCRYAESLAKEAASEMLCPVCGKGRIISKRTPNRRLLYLCPEKQCSFLAYARPHDQACPLCRSPYLLEEKTAAGKVFLVCPGAGCTFRRFLSAPEVPGAEEGEAPRKIRVRRLVRRAGTAAGTKRKVLVVRRKP